jgi:hypothetical protein
MKINTLYAFPELKRRTETLLLGIPSSHFMISTNQEAVYIRPLEQHHETDQRMQKASAFGVLLIRYEWRENHPSSFLRQFVLLCCCILSALFVLLYKVTLSRYFAVMSRVSNSFERRQV